MKRGMALVRGRGRRLAGPAARDGFYLTRYAVRRPGLKSENATYMFFSLLLTTWNFEYEMSGISSISSIRTLLSDWYIGIRFLASSTIRPLPISRNIFVFPL